MKGRLLTRFLRTLATQLFRVGNQRTINLHPVALFDRFLRDALLRRAYPNDAQDVLEFGRFRFLPEARGLEMDGKPVELKAREYELALFLFQNMGRLLSRDHLREVIWGHSAEVISRSLDTHVSRLRSLLDLRPANGYMITAVYGVGYRFEAVKPTAEQTASGSASQAQ